MNEKIEKKGLLDRMLDSIERAGKTHWLFPDEKH